MNIEDYKNAIHEIDKDAERKKLNLAIEYSKSHNKVKVGDIVEDHIGKILVGKISHSVSVNYMTPCAVYTGMELKKNNEPFKHKKIRTVWQTNLLGHNP